MQFAKTLEIKLFNNFFFLILLIFNYCNSNNNNNCIDFCLKKINLANFSSLIRKKIKMI